MTEQKKNWYLCNVVQDFGVFNFLVYILVIEFGVSTDRDSAYLHFCDYFTVSQCTE